MELKWLCNDFDPSKPDYDLSIILSPNQSVEEAIAIRRKFLADKIIGKPKSTSAHTVEQLESMGLVGIYVRE